MSAPAGLSLPVPSEGRVAVPHVYLSAGEPSGDEYAAGVARALWTRNPAVSVRGMGGREMAAAGVSVEVPIEGLTTMGLVEILATLPAHAAALRQVRRIARTTGPAAAILVDYPGFHRRVARGMRALDVPVIQFVAPKLWAWGAWRARHYRDLWAQCAVIFPFEERVLAGLGLGATYVGHPVMDRAVPSRSAARAALGASEARCLVALFPGSRDQEVTRLWPVFREAATLIKHRVPDAEVWVAADVGTDHEFHTASDRADEIMAAADVVVCKSGTSNLLAARCGVPMVVAYRMHGFTYRVARRLVRIPWISPVNIMARDRIVPELVHDAVTADALANHALRLLESQTARRQQLDRFPALLDQLGPLDAVGRVADLALECARVSGRSGRV